MIQTDTDKQGQIDADRYKQIKTKKEREIYGNRNRDRPLKFQNVIPVPLNS